VFNCCLNVLNFFWLSKMASGALKVRPAPAGPALVDRRRLKLRL